MNEINLTQKVENNQDEFLGIELGSTRIKAILIGQDHLPIVSASHDWENRYEDGIWTYHDDAIWTGLQDCYRKLSTDYKEKFGHPLTTLSGMGISAMMHGYLAFDKDDRLLVPFRTWRNTMTETASEQLSELFQFNIPQRWSIAHLYQAVLNNEPHVGEIKTLTTLAGYIHWKLTGKKVLGIGDASGMFPINAAGSDFDAGRLDQFDQLIAARGYPWTLRQILPVPLLAGSDAGCLSQDGARLLDPSGVLQPGIPLCPPEGDAGTGMVATNSVAERTCNVSAGTSIFAMVVLERPLSQLYPEIDMVTTPAGKPVAMVHANNCTSDINAWVDLFDEVLRSFKFDVDQNTLYETLFNQALSGDPDGGGLLTYNFFSGEPIVHLEKGAPLFVRTAESNFSLANFMRVQLFSALGTMKLGMDILFDREHVRLDQVLGHGGFFKTRGVGQNIMAAALNVPVSVMETAGEGGAWGIALLAAYLLERSEEQSLESYLVRQVFADAERSTVDPTSADVAGFSTFMQRYTSGLAIEKTAVGTIANQ
jgi:sugar (pentulose or hexulose) kinase